MTKLNHCCMCGGREDAVVLAVLILSAMDGTDYGWEIHVNYLNIAAIPFPIVCLRSYLALIINDDKNDQTTTDEVVQSIEITLWAVVVEL